jgi:cytidine deaminase
MSLRQQRANFAYEPDNPAWFSALLPETEPTVITAPIFEGFNAMTTTFDELYQQAKSVLNPRRLTDAAEAGGVGAALLTASGRIYTGVCIDTACSMGFCAEHAAAATMITAGENHVVKMVAVDWDGSILPPCGRCREFINQLHDENLHAEVMVAEGVILTLQDLLPYNWRQSSR